MRTPPAMEVTTPSGLPASSKHRALLDVHLDITGERRWIPRDRADCRRIQTGIAHRCAHRSRRRRRRWSSTRGSKLPANALLPRKVDSEAHAFFIGEGDDLEIECQRDAALARISSAQAIGRRTPRRPSYSRASMTVS